MIEANGMMRVLCSAEASLASVPMCPSWSTTNLPSYTRSQNPWYSPHCHLHCRCFFASFVIVYIDVYSQRMQRKYQKVISSSELITSSKNIEYCSFWYFSEKNPSCDKSDCGGIDTGHALAANSLLGFALIIGGDTCPWDLLSSPPSASMPLATHSYIICEYLYRRPSHRRCKTLVAVFAVCRCGVT